MINSDSLCRIAPSMIAFQCIVDLKRMSLMRYIFLLVLLIAAACAPQAAVTPTDVPTPTQTPTSVPTLEPSPFPTLQPSITPMPEATETPWQLNPLIDEIIPPPLELDLPDDWQYGYNTVVINDIGDLRPIPFALYTGPVTGGQGFIVLLWGFPSVTSGIPVDEGYGVPNLALDGTRLLRFIIVETACTIGTDVEREYNFEIGGLPASGTQFSAVDCPENLPDTRGWLAGLQVEGMNFLFYMYTEPISAMDGSAPDELQAILDSIEFDVASFIAEQQQRAPEATEAIEPEATETVIP